MSAEVHDVLVKARDLIADPARWTKEADARNPEDRPVMAVNRRACKWCAYGAVIKAAKARQGLIRRAIGYLFPHTGHRGVSTFNDDVGTTHTDVLALFDRAIEATKP